MDRLSNDLLQGIDTIIVRVANIDLSKNWYVDQLGLNILWDAPKMNLVILDARGPTSLTLWQTDKPIHIDKETASYPIFKTKDAVLLREAFGKRNIKTGELIEDEYVKYFFFYDPDGNVLEACQVYE